MKKLTHNKVVIGSGLNALLYAFFNHYTLLLNTIEKPSRIERFTEAPLTGITNKLETWEKVYFLMSLAGKIPFADKISSIRIDEENKELKVFTNNSKLIKICCDEVVIFSDKEIEGLPIPIKTLHDDDKRKVLDWINVRSGMIHKHTHFFTDEDFVKEVYFYPSDRIDGNHANKKDLVAISYLTKGELNSIEHSDLFTRYKVVDLMKKAGIRGKRNGRDTTNPERYKYYAIKLETRKREVKTPYKSVYNNTSFIKFNYDSEEEVAQANKASRDAPYISKLYNYLGRMNLCHPKEKRV